ASTAYPAWSQSFRFPDAVEVEPGDTVYFDHTGDWVTPPNRYPAQSGVIYRFVCPAANQTGNVWGTDVYTDDSSICEAAVHAGVIGREGGTVHYERLGGQQSFRGSIRNGVQSSDYGAWPGSFRFVEPEEQDDAPGTPDA
ncbi:MAG TPA: LCCL domain-containing protein, partial [Gemmatimonadota bacterium]|nr:LCCL domain-containing protein [Gemmatimonadota bacterium]